jgi:7-cyano-7-deazaguanine synthase
MTPALQPVAVLLGGGVESTALIRRFLGAGRRVIPVHVHCGLIWDDCETRYVQRFCTAVDAPGLAPLVEIKVPLADFLQGHWAVTGVNVPRAGAAAADLEIPLRNLTLLSFALHRLRPSTDCELALGTTADNCYRDGSRLYFDKCAELFSLDSGWPVRVLTPLIDLNKTQVIQGSDSATLALSFSCVNPQEDFHCGQCIKCGRRQAAFRTASVPDPTVYANPVSSSCKKQPRIDTNTHE